MSMTDIFFRLMLRFGLGLILSVTVFTSYVRADEAATKAAQGTIAGQIEAFKAGDDAKAYSYAAPNIQMFFPDVQGFMAMVKKGYQPVWKPQTYDFGPAKEADNGQISQEVFVTGPDGKPWTAIYTLVRGPKGDWLINGVQIVPGDDSSA
jgi:Domain of unknown function (DUF4864)